MENGAGDAELLFSAIIPRPWRTQQRATMIASSPFHIFNPALKKAISFGLGTRNRSNSPRPESWTLDKAIVRFGYIRSISADGPEMRSGSFSFSWLKYGLRGLYSEQGSNNNPQPKSSTLAGVPLFI